MSAVTVVSNLLALGVQVKDAWTKSGKEWKPFLASPEFAALHTSTEKLLGTLKHNDLQSAVAAIRKKQADFLHGREITALSVDELSQFSALADVEHQLVNKLLKAPPERENFLGVLVHDVLPTLIRVGKVVVPLLI